jgi:hypothetical protein
MVSSVVVVKKNMDSKPRSTMLFAKGKKNLIAQGLV